VICGTDTLGVGVNIPIRTVLFSSLAKFDGEKVALLGPREFKQIAGRAGRKGFDEQGSVVCQAPEQVIARKRASARGKKVKAPRRRTSSVVWNRDAFQKLIYRTPVPLESRFKVTHGLIVQVLQRDPAGDATTGYRALVELIDHSHSRPGKKARLRREAARIFRSLRRAGIVDLGRDPETQRFRVAISPELQDDFSLHHTLSLYLVDAARALDLEAPSYALELLSLVEAILEDPRPILYAQENTLKSELVAHLKAERVPYEERMRQLDEVSYPKPEQEFIYATFDYFAERHPWVQHENIRPKSIAREIYEGYSSFGDYVRRYSIARSEGRLLRYLGDVYKTLAQNVPDFAKTPDVHDIMAFLRMTVAEVDASLFEEWENLRAAAGEAEVVLSLEIDLAHDPHALRARVRAELHRLVQLLSEKRYAEAAVSVAESSGWDSVDFERALAPFFEEYGELVFDHRARLAEHTSLTLLGPRRWQVLQTLIDPVGDDLWCIEAEVDLHNEREPTGPLLRLLRIGS
jgi:hypothetical protein